MKEMTPEEGKQHLKRIAADCAVDAIKFRKRFKGLMWFDIGWLIFFGPLSILFLLSGHPVTVLFGLVLSVCVIVNINGAKDNWKRSHQAFRDYMKLRQDCLDNVKQIEDFEREYRGYDNP